MHKLVSFIRQFLSELRQRDVYQVAVTYMVVGFFVIEAADVIVPRLGLPSWTVTLVITLAGLGFPIALVMAWALEMTPEGVRVEESAGEEAEGSVGAPAGSPRDLWVGASVLVLFLLGAWWLLGGLPGEVGGLPGEEGTGSTAPESAGAPPETRARAVAVLPFEVSGAGAEAWRDGMVTMLSTGLDGAAGLRAIADRTVFAAWQRRDSVQAGASTREALAVARKIGAEYAIVGSAVQLGTELRLVAEVRRTGSGARLGQVEVQGSPDSATALANRLTREVLGVLLEKSEDQVPSVNLSSITTSSLEALKAFLRGERHFRAGKYKRAIEDYEAATRRDSAFALAHARLAVSRGWGGGGGADAALRRAYRLSERLPQREQRLIRARYLRKVQGRPFRAADSLRQLTEEYPEDPSMWYFLGEALYHGGLPGGLIKSETAFQEAVRLDPGAAPYHHHLVDLAFKVHHDSALVARRIEAHPEGERKRWCRAIKDLIFGPPSRQKEAWARLDTLSVQTWQPLGNPLDWELRDRLLSVKNTKQSRFPRAVHKLRGGRVDAAVRQLPDSPQFDFMLALSQTFGYPVPDSLLRARLRPGELGPDANPMRLRAIGLYRVEQGRGEELRRIFKRLRAFADRPGVPPRAERQVMGMVRNLKGYRAFRAGSLQVAKKHWAEREVDAPPLAIWRGDLYRKLGAPERAEGWYQAAWSFPLAHERLGQLYEQMGQPGKARAAYRRFIAAWEGADPELQPRVKEARRRLQALKGPAGERGMTGKSAE
jgi:hypothetical protein